MASDALLQFRESISQFSFTPSKHSTDRNGDNGISSPRRSKDLKRPSSTPALASSSPKKRKKRAYAPPETYANLRQVNDYLREDLDGNTSATLLGFRSQVDSGVLWDQVALSLWHRIFFHRLLSPGRKSAESGHHYGNPSNHFWWCLHASGFTDAKISPNDDWSLPERFSLGLTNLVDRPTAEQTELSTAEQLASVPIFLEKIARYRPCVVVFVGISIAKAVETKLGVMHTATQSWGMRSFKLVHPNPSKFAETIFFAAPSTSGLVTHFKRPEKGRIFGEARKLVEDLKAGNISTANMTVVKPHQIAPPPKFDLDLSTLLTLPESLVVKEEKEESALIQ
ncbi:UDG domain-containing protein [Mycena indigotica]|uniref:UDG domain-containing protein n=1 Tax=Mycena indigotica TaxID=2126181 RepID=A0A8H6S9H3_9AGAR|nr:UDG domain-containing protein [Mycena indigotica]KAF7294832.1 UDG domain-containing protein [Mycena indigotica]